jgi:tRNA pseudouridine38-40 synthase
LRTFKLTLAYDGTRHVGWQRQATGTSIQGLLESALSAIEGRSVTVTGAGRTDAGVHALGQVASLALAHPLPPAALLRALNARLPDDVRVRAVEEAGAGFHARFSAIGKTYRYRIRTAPIDDPFDHRFAWHVTYLLDLGEMRAAMAMLMGRHDFRAFQSAGSDVKTTVRTVTRAELRVVAPPASWPVPMVGEPAGDVLEIEFDADGFLRQMVRAMVGTLVEVGAGRRTASSLADVLASGDRGQAGATAPPHGLFLVRVVYPVGE